MQFAEPEILGVVHHNGVDIRHINTRLDDGSGEKHVIVMIGKVEDRFLQFLRRHLSMCHDSPCIGHEAVNHIFEVI